MSTAEITKEPPILKVLAGLLRTKTLVPNQNKGFYDEWAHANALIRYAGGCVVCGRRTFQLSSDYGKVWNKIHWYDPDPRGAIPEGNCSHFLVASEYDMIGQDVPMCFACSNTREKYEQGLKIAREQWFTKIETITVIGRRWFDKVNGNTYFTARILINGRTVHALPMEYGYGDQYMHAAFDWLDAHSFVTFLRRTTTPKGCDPIIEKAEPPWQLCDRLGIHCEYSATDVGRRKDL